MSTSDLLGEDDLDVHGVQKVAQEDGENAVVLLMLNWLVLGLCLQVGECL